jgi:hypothetical protein
MTVTAVGRLLRPKNGEPKRHHVIAVRPDGTVRTLINRQLPDAPKAKQG